MKTINYFYCLNILLLCFIRSKEKDDSCPNGMRKTYVDDISMNQYGSGRAFMAAACFFQYPGSLFFKRKVLIEPRFEVHLKAFTDYIEIIEKEKEQKIYGFTIVISGYKNTISGLEGRSFSGDESDNYIFEDIGYNNFVNSLIIEFDFEKNSYDPDSDSFSIRYCQSSCSISDYKAMYSSRLNSQRFDPSKKNNWDFRLIYDTKKLYLYSGPNEVIFSANLDLEATLGTNIGFVGFTGFMESNRREITLLGSFICEDNYDISKMKGNFLINGGLTETAYYYPGEQVNYILSFINNKDQIIPHTYGYNIWNYSFSLVSDCGDVYNNIRKETNYTLSFKMKACTKAGLHSVYINEKSKGNFPKIYYNVNPGPLDKISLIGHDGKIENVPLKYLSSYNYLSYGDSPQGDFIIKDKLILVLDFKMTDKYGNLAEISLTTTLFSFKKIEEGDEPSPVTTEMLNYNIKKVDNHYQLIIEIRKYSTYQLEANGYMNIIRFNIIPEEVDSTINLNEISSILSTEVEKEKNILTEGIESSFISEEIDSTINLNDYSTIDSTEVENEKNNLTEGIESFISEEKDSSINLNNDSSIDFTEVEMEKNNSKEEIEFCNAINFFNLKCNIRNIAEEKDNMIIDIRKHLLNNITIFLNKTNINENERNVLSHDIIFSIIPIKNKNTSFRFLSSNKYRLNSYEYIDNKSMLNLFDCEQIIRKKHNISENETLYMFRLDILFSELYIPIVEYEIYSSKKKIKLDLNYCNDIKIQQTTHVKINEDNAYKHISSSDYYNDKCFAYSINGTDMILDDRRDDYINKNLSLCEYNCNNDNYDFKSKTTTCTCNVKTRSRLYSDIYIDDFKLMNNFKNIKSITNIYVIKCLNLLFNINAMKKNIGNYIILIIILIHIIALFFVNKEYKILYYKIKNFMEIFKGKKNGIKKNKNVIKKRKEVINKKKIIIKKKAIKKKKRSIKKI